MADEKGLKFVAVLIGKRRSYVIWKAAAESTGTLLQPPDFDLLRHGCECLGSIFVEPIEGAALLVRSKLSIAVGVRRKSVEANVLLKVPATPRACVVQTAPAVHDTEDLSAFSIPLFFRGVQGLGVSQWLAAYPGHQKRYDDAEPQKRSGARHHNCKISIVAPRAGSCVNKVCGALVRGQWGNDVFLQACAKKKERWKNANMP